MGFITLDNGGGGNCMYYAYGISLMYCLRSHREKERYVNEIFAELGLDEKAQSRLKNLLNSTKSADFSKQEQWAIESILGPSLRQYTAKKVEEEFLDHAKSTQIFTSASYAIRTHLKKALRESSDPVAQEAAKAIYIHARVVTDLDRENYSRDEIYKVRAIKDRLETYPSEVMAKALSFYKKKCQELGEEASPEREQQQSAIMDEVIDTLVLHFFNRKEQKYLKKYIEHLARDRVWGTETNLYILHRHIVGERKERVEDDRVEIVFDRPIELQVHHNGQNFSHGKAQPEMVLNNLGNYHWVSKIPYSLLIKQLPRTSPRLTRTSSDLSTECIQDDLGHSSDGFELEHLFDLIDASNLFDSEKRRLIHLIIESTQDDEKYDELLLFAMELSTKASAMQKKAFIGIGAGAVGLSSAVIGCLVLGSCSPAIFFPILITSLSVFIISALIYKGVNSYYKPQTELGTNLTTFFNQQTTARQAVDELHQNDLLEKPLPESKPLKRSNSWS